MTMLEELLERISQGGGFSTHSLALEFGVSNELMEAMLGDLVRAGYLRSMDRCEEADCGKCGMSASCKPRGKIWMLADKKLTK